MWFSWIIAAIGWCTAITFIALWWISKNRETSKVAEERPIEPKSEPESEIATTETAPTPVKPYYLATLTVAKDESMVIVEFVDHYRQLGVDHMYIIDNGSTDNMKSNLDPFINDGFVTYYYLSEPHKQVEHYNMVYKYEIQESCQWLAIVDVDEYLYCPNGDNLKTYLASRPDDDKNITVLWSMFGSSGLEEQPSSIRKGFTLRGPNLHSVGKTILRTTSTNHVGVHTSGECVVAEPTEIRLNHYCIMSWEYFEKVKMSRGDVLNPQMQFIRDRKYFDSYDRDFSSVEDRGLADLVDTLV